MVGHFGKTDHIDDQKPLTILRRSLTWRLLMQMLYPALCLARQRMAGMAFDKQAISRLAIAPLGFRKLFANGAFSISRWAHDTSGSGRRARHVRCRG